MPGVEARNFSSPDETRAPDKTLIELLSIAGGQIGRYTFQPGWRWSECIKPVVHTDTCQVDHIGYMISGSLHLEHEDGTKQDIVPGMVYRIAPGHDAWNAGSEPAVVVEFQGAANFAKG
ncbi:MAG: cupin domain-containing protein [Dehalococcoidia bacterium]